ncbi:WD40-repeat-containing domain protein [Hyaloraphidium curvatum]|nr:WD40-repeat-containing domain protein [Hyaloraphidium curvatum]
MGNKKRTSNGEGDAEEAVEAHVPKKGPAAPGPVSANEADELEYEDPWEDFIEEDQDAGEVVIDEDSSDEDDEESDDSEAGAEPAGAMDLDPARPEGKGTEKKPRKEKKRPDLEDEDDDQDLDAETFLPGGEIGEGEVLVADMSTYVMLHPLSVEWPCLSFDILRDNLGASRTQFPVSMYMVAGSQADKAKDNRIYVMKLSQLHRNKENDGEDDDEMSDDGDLDEDPILEYKAVPHVGGVNRVRRMAHPTSHIVATWADTGKVHIWDLSDTVASLDTPGMKAEGKLVNTVKQHGAEGFAMDWSPVQIGKLLTGDTASKIYLTTATPPTFTTDAQPYVGHTASVEDIQFSPSEATVFASCSADQSIRIWDTRTRKKAQLTVAGAHSSDINAISWNRSVDYLLASGADDGGFAVWDMRTFVSTPSKPTPAASFRWHKEQVTSVEWHPFEDSMIAVSGADDQVTLWDLAVERDPEEEKELLGGRTGQQALGGLDVPPQLMFIHQGQTNLKEVHWHPQIPGLLVSTAADGFNIFKTINS